MKYFSGSAVFQFKWDQVAFAYWNRYPNPYSTHVLSEDTLDRCIANGKLFTKRLITKTNKMPKWGEKIIRGPKYVAVIEESVVDPREKTLVTYTRNIGYTRIMTVEEKCVYKPSCDNKEWTECSREAWISSNLYGFSYALQHFGYERFKKNVGKTVKGFEHILNNLFTQNKVHELPTHTGQAEKLKATALKAKEIAKSKAAPVVASVAGGTTAS